MPCGDKLGEEAILRARDLEDATPEADFTTTRREPEPDTT